MSKQSGKIWFTRASPPPTIVRDSGYVRTDSPTRIPTKLPNSYPTDLHVETELILGQAVKRFPTQSAIPHLITAMISGLEAHCYDLIRRKRLEATEAVSELKGLISLILMMNCTDHERDRQEQQLAQSENWLTLLKGIRSAHLDAVQSEIPILKTGELKIKVEGKTYRLTPQSAEIVRFLRISNRLVSTKEIQAAVGSGKISDSFRTPDAKAFWNKYVVKQKGLYRLKPPDFW